MKRDDIVKLLANRINQPHVIEKYLLMMAKAGYKEAMRDYKKTEEEFNCVALADISQPFIVRDWMSAEIHEFDTYEKAVEKYNEIYKATKDHECDIQLYKLLNNFNNVG